MKLSPTFSKLLTDRRVVQFIALLALVNVVGYVMVGKVKAMLTYVAFAVLVRFFSRNMAIVLGVPLILVNLLALQGNLLEGMENNDSTSTSASTNGTSTSASTNGTSTSAAPNGTSTSAAKKADDNKNKNKPDAKTGQGLAMNPIEEQPEAQETEQQGFEPGRRKNRGYEIDYATTVEDAYDQLNSILGGDGIKRLTADTQGLMKQQMQLAEAMKGMEPVIKQMGPMMESLKGMMGDGKDGLGGILDLAKKMTK